MSDSQWRTFAAREAPISSRRFAREKPVPLAPDALLAVSLLLRSLCSRSSLLLAFAELVLAVNNLMVSLGAQLVF